MPKLLRMRIFGGLGPLVWEEKENTQTVHKGLEMILKTQFFLQVRIWIFF
jgi:hypothetical protein